MALKTLYFRKELATDRLAKKNSDSVKFNVGAYFDLEATVQAKFWRWNDDYLPRTNKKTIKLKGKPFQINWIAE